MEDVNLHLLKTVIRATRSGESGVTIRGIAYALWAELDSDELRSLIEELEAVSDNKK